jgi:hypothetical protein
MSPIQQDLHPYKQGGAWLSLILPLASLTLAMVRPSVDTDLCRAASDVAGSARQRASVYRKTSSENRRSMGSALGQSSSLLQRRP